MREINVILIVNRFLGKLIKSISPILPDSIFLMLYFPLRTGSKLNLRNPKTFNQKLQWLKIHNRNPLYTDMVDKLKSKEWAAKIIGNEHIVKTLAVWNTPNEISFDKLPQEFIIKPNHNSGEGIIICKDKKKLDLELTKKIIFKAFKNNYYRYNREWPYLNVERKIFAEELLKNDADVDLKDYKFFCFGGEPKFLKVDLNRFHGHRANYYNLDWELQDFGEERYPADPKIIVEKPENFNEMVEFAKKLSKGQPFLRVDFYSVNGKTYFGELTFYPASGMGKWYPEGMDRKLGELIDLSIIDK